MNKVTVTEEKMKNVISMLNKINQADNKNLEKLLSYGVAVSDVTIHTECVIDTDSAKPLLATMGIVNGIMRTFGLPDIYQVWGERDIAGVPVPTLIKFEIDQE